MKKLIVIDACMREESRTRRILGPVVAALQDRFDIETFQLGDFEMPTVGREMLAERQAGSVPQWAVEAARKIAAADRIIIAAPFWDMSFPARLKVFFEHCSLYNITFADNGRCCYGLCKCQSVLYITTRGMNIRTGDPLEQATPYFHALSHLWGLGEIHCIAAENMDYSTPVEIEAKIAAATAEALQLIESYV